MIINIAGTSGSGKSYLMRGFMDWAQHRATIIPERVPGRRSPIGYRIEWDHPAPPAYVIGAYDSPTGGCDTIRDVVKLFDHIRAHHNKQEDVLYEGLFVMNMQRGPALAEMLGRNMLVIHLTTPYATCLEAINERRAERGVARLLTTQNTKGNFVRAANYCSRMRAAGAHVIVTTREAALTTLTGVLARTPPQVIKA